MNDHSLGDYDPELYEPDEPENYPCRKCGRTDLPLHPDYQCAECSPHGDESLQPGQRVWLDRHGGVYGTVRSEYLPGMYEVRLPSGTIVVPRYEMTPQS